MMPHFEWTRNILFDVINMYGDLEIYVFVVSARQNVIWLGVSGLTLNLMSWACQGYTSASEIEMFDINVKQKALNDGKRWKHQSLIPVYATFYRSIMTLKWYFSTSWLFSELNQAVK